MCGCGGSEAINVPESADLIAVIHPVHATAESQAPGSMIRRDSTSSTTSLSSVSSSESTTSSNTAPTSNGRFTGSRLRFSNRSSKAGLPTTTISEHGQDQDEPVSNIESSLRGSAMENIHVRIHQYGFPCDVESMPNPVVHSFALVVNHQPIESCGVRLDLGLGGEGILGRTVSLSDGTGRLVGEGVLGRI